MNAIKTLRKYRQQVAKTEMSGSSTEAVAKKHSDFARKVAKEMSFIPVCHKSFGGVENSYKVKTNNPITINVHFQY